MRLQDSWPIAIDPPGCGCTECIVGEYVPLDQATKEQIMALFSGKLRDNTNHGDISISIVVMSGNRAWTLGDLSGIDLELLAGKELL